MHGTNASPTARLVPAPVPVPVLGAGTGTGAGRVPVPVPAPVPAPVLAPVPLPPPLGHTDACAVGCTLRPATSHHRTPRPRKRKCEIRESAALAQYWSYTLHWLMSSDRSRDASIHFARPHET